jgi:acyl dehydratase
MTNERETNMDDHSSTPEPLIQRGRTWQEMPAGARFRTSTRTVTEYDLVTLVTWAGITEPLFTDARHGRTLGYEGRLVPGILTYCMAEGLVVQTGILNGTGIAVLGNRLDHTGPVYVGDTLQAEIEITESRATSKGPERGVVSSVVTVTSDRSGEVLVYHPVRLVKGASSH